MRQMEQQEYMFGRERKIEGENEREREGGFQGLPSSHMLIDLSNKQKIYF